MIFVNCIFYVIEFISAFLVTYLIAIKHGYSGCYNREGLCNNKVIYRTKTFSIFYA